MVKKELRDLKLNIGEESFAVKPPFTVYSGSKVKEGLQKDTAISVSAVLRLSADELRSAHHALVVRGVLGRFYLCLNDEEIGHSENAADSYFDLSGKLALGDNLVEIKFVGDEKALLSSGIEGSIEHIRYECAIIKDISVNRRFEDGGAVSLDVNVSMLGDSDHIRAVATLMSSSGQIYYGGLTRGRGHILIKDPLYWWPKGLGVQNLYKLTVNLYGEQEIEDTKEIRVGLRKISTPVNPNSSLLEVNGVPFLPMGSVFGELDEPDPQIYRKKLNGLITAAAMSNFNTFVLPLGVRLPSSFYDLCDINGILVIREFSGNEERDFTELSELSGHPSLGFIDLVGAGENVAAIAERLHSIRPDMEFSNYERAPRYPSCFSLPAEKSCFEVLTGVERNLFSKKSLEIMGDLPVKILSEISENYLCPGSLSDAAYLSGLVSADTIGERMTRARLTGGEGRAIFDRINSDSLLASVSSVDSFIRKKALHYKAEKFFAPLAVFAERDGYSVCFSVSNERRLAFIGQLEFKVIDNSNRVIYKEIADCQVAKNSSKKLFTKDLAEYISGHENEYYLEYYIREGLSIASRGTLLFTEPKNFELLDPHIQAKIVGRDRRYSITLTSAAYAKDVEIDFADSSVLLYENYVDLTQNTPYKISFTLLDGEDSSESLAASVKVRSLYEIGK